MNTLKQIDDPQRVQGRKGLHLTRWNSKVSSSIGFLWLAVLVLWLSLQKPSFGQATYLGPPQSTHATSVAPVSNWSPLVPSALGGLITGFFAVVATWVTYRNNRKLNQAQHQRKINGLLGAIRNEVEIGYMVYRQKAGEQIEALPEGKPCMKRFELTQEYFIVYPNNTEIVGQTDDPELCKAIIDAYNMMNYTKDTLGVNNWYLDTLLDSKVQRSSHPFLNLGAGATERGLLEHAAKLKAVNVKLKDSVGHLFRRIDQYLPNSSKA